MHDRLTYSVEEAAALLGISPAKAYRSVRTGELRAVPLGRRRVIPAHVIDALLGLGEPQATAPGIVNEVEVAGRLTRPPEERSTRTGARMATFRLAIGRRDHPVFIDVVVFGKLAEGVSILTRGQLVCVAGRLDQRDWTTADGTRRSVHQIVARRIEALEPPSRDPMASSESHR